MSDIKNLSTYRRHWRTGLNIVLTVCLTIAAFQTIPSVNEVEAQATPSDDCSCTPPIGSFSSDITIATQALTCGTGIDIGHLTIGQDVYVSPMGLYKKMMFKVRLEPNVIAQKSIAGQFGYSDKEVMGLLDGNIQPIMDRNKNLTFDQAALKMQELRDAFKAEQEVEELKSSLVSELAPIEIYANGNTADSGFDLIYDLDIIAYILFGGEMPQANSGTGFSGNSSNNSNNSSSSNQNNSSNSQNNNNNSDNQSSSNSSSSSSSNNSSNTSQNDNTNQGPNSSGNKNPTTSTFDSSSLDAVSCDPDNQALTAALDDFYAENPDSNNDAQNSPQTANKPSVKNPIGKGIKNNQLGNTNKQTGDNNSPTGSGNPDDEKAESQGFKDQDTEPAEANDFTLPPLCKDDSGSPLAYCIEIKTESGGKVTYKKEENCIFCHVQHIKKLLKETIDHNLLPSKITGNLMEEPSCKNTKAGSSLNMNIWVIAQPFKPTLQTDAIEELKSKDLMEQFAFLLGDVPGTAKNTWDYFASPDDKIQPIEQMVAEEITKEAPPGVKITDIAHQIDTLMDNRRNEATQKMQLLEMALRTGNQANFSQELEKQMRLMLGYFQTMVDIFNTMNTVTCQGAGKPNGLINKEFCS